MSNRAKSLVRMERLELWTRTLNLLRVKQVKNIVAYALKQEAR
jgi:hypothetical protein